jgi:hypothetical protein
LTQDVVVCWGISYKKSAYPLTFLRGTIPENSIVKSMNEIVEKRI